MMVPDPRERWGEEVMGVQMDSYRHHRKTNSSFGPFPLEKLQAFSLLSDHDKHSSDRIDFWGLQGSR